MDRKEILSHVDHTLLSPTATWDDIKQVLDDAVAYGCASACIPPAYVKRAQEYVGDDLTICTVIGFPNGYNDRTVKGMEAQTAVDEGADEIDMVINIGKLKDGDDEYVRGEIDLVTACANSHVRDITVKVIVESSDLTQKELERACRIVNESDADYIKTSTGFSKNGGATLEAVETMARLCPFTGIKAAGGISSFEDAEAFLEAGATRLGTSRLVAIAKEEDNQQSA